MVGRCLPTTTLWLARGWPYRGAQRWHFRHCGDILVLDFHTPEPADIHAEAELLRALAASAPRLLPWLLSSLTLGIFWLGQQTQLSQLARLNRDLAWLHFLFLAVVTVLPFSTRLLADFLTYRTAFLVYWVDIVVLGACLYATWVYAERAKLIRNEAHGDVSRAVSGALWRRSRSTRSARLRARQRDARDHSDHAHPAQLRGRAEAADSFAPLMGRSALERQSRILFGDHRRGVRRSQEMSNSLSLTLVSKASSSGKTCSNLVSHHENRSDAQTRLSAISE